MIEAVFEIGPKAFDKIRPIRYKVFTVGQGVAENIEQDSYDYFAHHVIVSEGGKAIATGRLIFKDGEFLIGRIAVLELERGKNYGDLVVRMLVDRAFTYGALEVVVHAQLQVAEFYKKIGFHKYGIIYKEASIEHISMSVKQEDLISPCKKKNTDKTNG